MSAPPARGGGATRCETPRQTCPRPDGFGRNLRSKTRWFAGFCNSHQVSHFATFFIDARAEISVAESRFDSLRRAAAPGRPRTGDGGVPSLSSWGCPWRVPRRGSLRRGSRVPPEPEGREGRGRPARGVSNGFAGRPRVSAMILPQVHLRKPCYDFSFL